MVSYQIYKIIHVVSIVIYFSAFAVTVAKTDGVKTQKMLKGIFGLLIFVSGMGLIARLGLPHGEPWPLWIKVKLGIWSLAVIGAPMIIKRFTGVKKGFYIFCIFLLVLASYMANYKIN